MIQVIRNLGRLRKNQTGSVTVEGSVLAGLLTVFIGGGVEAGHAMWQWNSAQQSARVGARVASMSDPVADTLTTMTGLSNNVSAGDPLPAYEITCSGATQSCSAGNFNTDAFNRIIYGGGETHTCSNAARHQRGMCDLYGKIKPENVTITYESSGLGVAGEPALPVPLITIKVSNVSLNFVFVRLVSGNTFGTLADIEVGVIGEDLNSSI